MEPSTKSELRKKFEYEKKNFLPLLSVLNSVWADNFSNSLDKLFSSTKGDALMFFALTVTL